MAASRRGGPRDFARGQFPGRTGGKKAFRRAAHPLPRLQEATAPVMRTQWLEPVPAGCNIGGKFVVTRDGSENPPRHAPLETCRVPA